MTTALTRAGILYYIFRSFKRNQFDLLWQSHHGGFEPAPVMYHGYKTSFLRLGYFFIEGTLYFAKFGLLALADIFWHLN
jgi:hypothetical protein